MAINERITAEPSDEQLVERVRQGNRDAFHRLYARHTPMLLATFRAFCPRGIDVEDVVQDVWVRVFNALQTFDNQHFRGWLYQIARNRLYDLTGKKSRQLEAAFPDSFEPADSASAEDDSRVDALRDCLDQLDGPFVRMIIRVKLEGESPENVASREGVKRATIDSRIHRGMEQLEDCVRGKLR